MTDFLLELLSEEIPARMQERARADLARLFEAELGKAGLSAEAIETYATPRRLALIARGLPAETAAVREETKGPRTSAPPQALEGFLRKTGLAREQLEERDGIYYAVVDKPGRATAAVLAEAIPAIIRAFPWPKSMRWGEASASTESLRWVRPLQGIVALFGEEIVPFEIAGIRSGAATVGHRFHHPGIITIGSANDYVEKLRACRVIVDPAERRRIIAEGAAAAARDAGLTLVEDAGLLDENAGLTEWPVPILGRFDPAYLDVPPEVIQLTMRTNQKYFSLLGSSPALAGEGDQPQAGGGARSEAEGQTSPDGVGPSTALRAVPLPEHARGGLAPNFICTANIEPADGGAAIAAGNEKVLAARLSDAKFFWEQDLKIPLDDQAKKLDQIVFHEKLGTVADKVDRVAKLARWLVEEGIVKPSPARGEGRLDEGERGEGRAGEEQSLTLPPGSAGRAPPSPLQGEGRDLAHLAERAARLAKADLVTGMVGEFPELQGVIGGYLARAQGEDPRVADAIRDHYKPVGQGDEVPTDPVTVTVSLADKLDTVIAFFIIQEQPTGSRDPYALRRAALACISLILTNRIRFDLAGAVIRTAEILIRQIMDRLTSEEVRAAARALGTTGEIKSSASAEEYAARLKPFFEALRLAADQGQGRGTFIPPFDDKRDVAEFIATILVFFLERLIVQQRSAGIRHDLVDAVFSLADDSDLVRVLARVRALQAFVETPEGADLLAGYKRAANILKKEGWGGASRAMADAENDTIPQTGEEDPLVLVDDPDLAAAVAEFAHPKKTLSYTPLPEEQKLIESLDSAEPRARAAVEAEDFEGAMAALASLRAPVDAFFDKVTVNDPDRAKREARLDLLARMRDAVHQVADFSRIEG